MSRMPGRGSRVVGAPCIIVGTDILEVRSTVTTPEQTMADDRYEPKRVLGFRVRTGPQAKQDEESRRVMGLPVDWFGSDDSVDRDQLWRLAHPIRGYKRWLRRRRLGPYAVDEDQRH
jgi:hypothetical protein